MFYFIYFFFSGKHEQPRPGFKFGSPRQFSYDDNHNAMYAHFIVHRGGVYLFVDPIAHQSKKTVSLQFMYRGPILWVLYLLSPYLLEL